jgi:predicted Rossmann fold flavoprotein
MKYDVIVIGGGAAGLFCAIEAGKRRRNTLVLERNTQLGRKILISGGSRCNFTNRQVSAENFISRNPHFCKSALARFSPQDFVRLVEKHNIEYYEKKLGQLFCRTSSRAIVEMLENECGRAGVEIKSGIEVRAVESGEEFTIKTDREKFTADKLVIASGGLSFPKVGATGFGLNIARQFGLKIEKTRPSLVPLVISGKRNFTKLAGVSFNATVETGGTAFRDDVLFTHKGMSGPAILQASNYWERDQPLTIDTLPDIDIRKLIIEDRKSRRTLSNFLSQFLPSRVAEAVIDEKLGSKPLDQIGNKDIEKINDSLKNWNAVFSGTEGYDRAEVMIGGVSTSELNSNSMAVNKFPKLYFIGEVVDVTGWLGGYNFQWAWASGFAAGNDV